MMKTSPPGEVHPTHRRRTLRRVYALKTFALVAIASSSATAVAQPAAGSGPTVPTPAKPAQPTPDQQQPGSPTGTPSKPGDEPGHDQATDQPPTGAPAAHEAPPPSPAEATITAADVANAPRPGQEHGRVDPIDTGDGAGRVLGRIVLWIPRIPVEIVFEPIRGLLYLQERYHVANKIASVFVSENGKFGIYPTALRETGFGINYGVRAFVKNVFGAGEKLSLRAGFGGQSNRVFAADLDTGKRISKYFSAGVNAAYENRNRDRFFGYGNEDETDEAGPMPVDVRTPGAPNISSRFKMDIARVTPRVHFNLPARLGLTFSGALAKKTFDTTDETVSDAPIDQAYLTANNALPGFERGTTYFYGEAQLAYDSRRPVDHWDSPGIAGTGGLALGYFGRQTGLRDEDPDFYRMGVDLQRYFRLTPGPRVLELRYYGELVTGDRDLIPFTELPRLGGVDVLRGYVVNRFRDKVAMVGQATYRWLIGRALAGSLFVDAGRVYDKLSNVTLSDLRVGYGISLEAYTARGLAVTATVASSIDGGVFFYFAFNPVFDARKRVERY